jgi:hypothetical protein
MSDTIARTRRVNLGPSRDVTPSQTTSPELREGLVGHRDAKSAFLNLTKCRSNPLSEA